MVSGLFFTLFPIEQVRGANLRAEIAHGELKLEEVKIDAAQAASIAGLTPKRAELSMFLGDPVWRFEVDGGTHLVDAKTGERASPVSRAVAGEIAALGMQDKAGTPGEPW